MENVVNLYSEYGDEPPDGDGPYQHKIYEGRSYIDTEFPKLDYFLHCSVDREAVSVRADGREEEHFEIPEEEEEDDDKIDEKRYEEEEIDDDKESYGDDGVTFGSAAIPKEDNQPRLGAEKMEDHKTVIHQKMVIQKDTITSVERQLETKTNNNNPFVIIFIILSMVVIVFICGKRTKKVDSKNH